MEFLSPAKSALRKMVERAQRLFDLLPVPPEGGDRPGLNDSPEKLSDKFIGLIVEAIAQTDARVDSAAVTVPTIAALRALDVELIPSGALIEVLGYYAAGDGGGGQFRLDKSDTSTADDGGATIVLTSGARAKNLLTDRFSVLQFGAKPDGVTNSSAAIQAAINATPNGGTLLVPRGTYACVGLSIIKPITIQGSGRNALSPTTFLPADYGTSFLANGTGYVFNLSGRSPSSKRNQYTLLQPVTLRDFSIYGANRTLDAGGILYERLSYALTENVAIYQTKRSALWLEYDVTESIWSNVRTEFCGDRTAAGGSWSGSGYPAVSVVDQTASATSGLDRHNFLTFEDCQFIFSMGDAIQVDTKQTESNGRTVNNIKFVGCEIHGMSVNFTDLPVFAEYNASTTLKNSRLAEIRTASYVEFHNCTFWFGGQQYSVLFTAGTSSTQSGRSAEPLECLISGSRIGNSWVYGSGTGVYVANGTVNVSPSTMFVPLSLGTYLSYAASANVSQTFVPYRRRVSGSTDPLIEATSTDGSALTMSLANGFTKFQSVGGFFIWDNFAAANATKTWRNMIPRFVSTGNNFVGVSQQATATTHVVQYGGGTGLANGATRHDWFLAADVNSTATTPVMSLVGAGLGIGGDAAASTAFDVVSTVSGSRPAPTMSTVQRDAIPTKQPGHMVYGSSTARYEYYDGTRFWELAPVLRGSATLDFGSIAAGASQDLTLSVPGASISDLVLVADPGGTSSLFFKGRVSSADTVTIRAVNAGTSPVDYNPGLFRVLVFKA